MKRIALACAAALLFAASPAMAQVNGINIIPNNSQSGNVTGTSAQCVAPQNNMETLFLWNNGTGTIYYRSIDGTAPVASAAGTTAIASGTGFFWPLGTAPRTGLNCISDGGTYALTVTVGQ